MENVIGLVTVHGLLMLFSLGLVVFTLFREAMVTSPCCFVLLGVFRKMSLLCRQATSNYLGDTICTGFRGVHHLLLRVDCAWKHSSLMYSTIISSRSTFRS